MSEIVKKADESASQPEAKEAPYGAEYAKSGRAACKGCREPIQKGALRMSVRFQSKFFDGFQDNWYHFECFWKKARKNDINEVSIRGLDWLKWEDQELIRQRINELAASGETYTPKTAAIKVEHAKSGTGKCFSCKEKIPKDELRISGRSSFYHVDCFHKANTDQHLFSKSAEDLVGFDQLDDTEKSKIEKLFPKPTSPGRKREFDSSATTSGSLNDTPAVKKEKLENDEIKAALKKQADVLWNLREELKKNLDNEQMEELLIANKSYKSKKGGMERMLDKLVDMIAFGPAKPCPECNKTLTYYTDMHAYRCSGSFTEYARCLYTTKNPERVQFRIPAELKKENKYLKKLKSPLLSERVYPLAALEEKPIEASKAFNYLNFARNQHEKLKGSENNQKQVVKGGFVVDPRCTKAERTHVYVDPITKHPWQVNLSTVDISSGKNSYYKLQIVKDDKRSKFYLFRAWGRIGTTIGGTKTESYNDDIEECQDQFKFLFHEKSQNEWEDYVQGNFKKVPNGMDILEMDFTGEKKEDDKKTRKLSVDSSKSKLAREIKELISMVFDIKAMQNTMMEFEIDLEKMPLGRLSKNHILKAYKVLKDLQFALEKPEGLSKNEVRDFTNRFYTLIPHATGLGTPPFLDSHEILVSKTTMLDSLLDIEIAFNILKTDQDELEANGTKDIFDIHYSKLNCSMEVLDNSSDEFALINRYLVNTHAETHSIKLEIVNVLKIRREVEAQNFKKNIGNRYLLWHGSRLSNYAGILSQGLRIAPPEAPVTGYMFGKGVYFADMVTKSANYCYAVSGDGLLLLCDVALGSIQEEIDAKDLKKPKKGKNSVKGVGGTLPDPKENVQFDEMTVPCGKPIKSDKKKLSLLYNEYIVYDESQVQLRYIVRVKFNESNVLL